MSLKCAVDLGIPDIIHNHGNPMTVAELVAVLPNLNPAKSRDIYRLMRLLVHSGLFSQQKLGNDAREDGYVLTDASRRLVLKNHPLSVASPILKADPVLTKPWQFLGNWFQNPFHTAFGKSLWDYCSHIPQLNNSFNEAFATDARLVTSVLMDKYKGTFEGLMSLVDVGGGTGTVAKAIADAFPRIECTVFDLPHVVADLQGSKNLNYVGGNMFEAIPTADAVLLKSILHDWNNDECLKILCKEAISSSRDKEGGKVVIIDMVLMKHEKMNNDDEASSAIGKQLYMDLQMLVLNGGKEREEEEWADLLSAAGFSHHKITPILGLRSLIEAFP